MMRRSHVSEPTEQGVSIHRWGSAKLESVRNGPSEDIKVAPFDAQAAKTYGPIRSAYKDRNRDALNKLIASHAVALGVTLVTNNEADFVNYAGLHVENWVSSH